MHIVSEDRVPELFLLSRRHWENASLKHFSLWETKERAIFNLMTPTVSREGIDKASGYFKVARNFPIARRPGLLSTISGVTCSGNSIPERFDAYVRIVRKVANQFAEENAGGRRLRPISGVSKLLWYRFPLHGFIYDSQVLAAICKNGLTVRFDNLIDGFGGKPSDDREWNFMIAAAAYRTFALPLHAIVADIFKKNKLEAERAARLIDMLFWIEGDPKGLLQNTARVPDSIVAKNIDEAFDLCKSTISKTLRVPIA
jgi:hypothetical protein